MKHVLVVALLVGECARRECGAREREREHLERQVFSVPLSASLTLSTATAPNLGWNLESAFLTHNRSERLPCQNAV